jgi:hypothetical protein
LEEKIMQSIAPEMVEMEVTGEGVEIGGRKCPVGWHGEVRRTTARTLMSSGLAKPYAAPRPATKAVEPVEEVVQTPSEPNAEPEAEEVPAKGYAKRIERNGRK